MRNATVWGFWTFQFSDSLCFSISDNSSTSVFVFQNFTELDWKCTGYRIDHKAGDEKPPGLGLSWHLKGNIFFIFKQSYSKVKHASRLAIDYIGHETS